MNSEVPKGPVRLPHAYLSFDALVTRMECWLAGRIFAACSCSADTVRARLVQRLSEYLLIPYVQLLARRRHDGIETLPEMPILLLADISVKCDSGALEISSKGVVLAVRDFLGHWALALLAILGLIRGRPIQQPATVVFGIGAEGVFHEGSDARFLAYCQNGPLIPLHGQAPLLIQTTHVFDGGPGHRAHYHKYPLNLLAATWQFGVPARLTILAGHLAIVIKYAWAIARMPLMALLSRDYAQAAMMAGLARGGAINAIVYTNSSYTVQPLWSRAPRAYETHMIWYSQNTVPFVFRDNELASHVPNYRHMSVDRHWVWTARYREYLRAHAEQNCAIHVVGPIVWYLPPAPPGSGPAFAIQILVFDVTPVSAFYAETVGLLDNYYTVETVTAFLLSIIRARDCLAVEFDMAIEVCLKHKREYVAVHDRGYINLISTLSAREEIRLVAADANVYELIQTAQVSVVMPYSSPAYIADAMGKPSIYFDPTGQMKPTFEPGRLISFAPDEKTLLTQVRASLATALHQRGKVEHA